MKTIILFLLLLTIGVQLKAQEPKDSTVTTLIYIEQYEQWCGDSTHIVKEGWKVLDKGDVLKDSLIYVIEYGSSIPSLKGFKDWITEFKIKDHD